MTFTAGNRDISAVYKVGAELADELVGRARLDAATPLPAVYPNWYIDSLTDQPVSQELNAQ